MTKGEKKIRKERILQMERIMRRINNENIFATWLVAGVADGDLDENSKWEEVDDYYIEDETYSFITGLFLKLTLSAIKHGGFCE